MEIQLYWWWYRDIVQEPSGTWPNRLMEPTRQWLPWRRKARKWFTFRITQPERESITIRNFKRINSMRISWVDLWNMCDWNNKIAVKLKKNDVIHPGTAAVDYLRSIDFQGAIYCIGSTCLKNLLTEAGLDLLKDVRNIGYFKILFTYFQCSCIYIRIAGRQWRNR